MNNFYQRKFINNSLWYAVPVSPNLGPFHFIVVRPRSLDMQVAIYDFDSGNIRDNLFFNYDEIATHYIVTRID